MNFSKLIASLEESDGVAREVDVTNAAASATKDHPEAPSAEADSKGEAATAADTVTAGDGDGVTPTLQDAIDKGVQVGEDVTKMVAAQEALSTHIAAVEAFIEQNVAVPTALALAIQTSLKRHDPMFFKKTVPGLEAFEAPTGRMTVSLELLDKLKEGAKNVGAGIMAALKKLIEAIQMAMNKMFTDFGDLKKRLEAAEKKIKSGEIKSGEPLNYGGLRSLSANGDIVGSSADSVKLLTTASKGVLIDWPERVLSMVKQMSQTGKEIDVKDTAQLEQFWKASVNTMATSFQGVFNGLDVVKESSAEKNVVETTELPGGRKIVLTYNLEKLADGKVVAQNFSQGLSVKLERAEGEKASGDIKVPSKEDALSGITAAKELLAIGDQRRDVASSLREFNFDTVAGGHQLGGLLLSFAMAALNMNTAYTGYMNTTCKALVGYYEKIAGTDTSNGSGKEVALVK